MTAGLVLRSRGTRVVFEPQPVRPQVIENPTTVANEGQLLEAIRNKQVSDYFDLEVNPDNLPPDYSSVFPNPSKYRLTCFNVAQRMWYDKEGRSVPVVMKLFESQMPGSEEVGQMTTVRPMTSYPVDEAVRQDIKSFPECMNGLLVREHSALYL